MLLQSDKRKALAERIKQSSDVAGFPLLQGWNYEPCPQHETPDPGCKWQACGGPLWAHQRLGVMWLYTIGSGILGDVVGLGKGIQVIALTTLLKQRGELVNRAVVVCESAPPAKLKQWVRQYRRFSPGLDVIAAVGSRAERWERYMSNWDVCVVGNLVLLNDLDFFIHQQPTLTVDDDLSPLRDHDSKTARAFRRLSDASERTVIAYASPIQVALEELYEHSLYVGGFEAFGSRRQFENRYVRKEKVRIWTKGRRGDTTGRTRIVFKQVGYKNGNEFVAKIRPYTFRRDYDDVAGDVNIPELVPSDPIWLELHKAQRDKYTELQRGVLRILRDKGVEVRQAEAMAKFTYGAMVCAGLAAIGEPDGPGTSVKLDYIEERVQKDWATSKLVVYSRFRGTTLALATRMARLGIGCEVVWGYRKESGLSKREHEERQEMSVERFWQDDDCRVLVGTQSIEQSLNLQVSNHLVLIDTYMNPERMRQILGRIRRPGVHSHVFMHTLLAGETQEEKYPDVLAARQGLVSFAWGSDTSMYRKLSPMELIMLIRP